MISILLNALVLLSALGRTGARYPTTSSPYTTPSVPTTDLRGRMFTVSNYGGFIMYTDAVSPYSSPSPTAYPTSSPSSPYTSYPYTTPSPSLSALTVCLRYMAEEGKDLTLFSLTQGNYWNLLLERNSGMDRLSTHSTSQYFRSYRLLSKYITDIEHRPWTNLCVTWEAETGVAQVWRGGTVSIRKRVLGQMNSAPPVLHIYQFEGQVTDVEVWDRVLSSSVILDYMSGWYYNPTFYHYTPGNLLTWSKAIYSTTGDVLLEGNAYNSDHQPIRGQHQPPGPMRGKRKRKFLKGGRREISTNLNID
ncbi:jeltraxin-like [Salvelinus alpinus]|uniref:jeltraxin-like n=1 Tax=Salvelinus alpinus TaxID=8036 RepID=UPI0039FCE837